MAIQDPNSERRNLVVTSLSFIIFYLGEGHRNDNNVTLQIINITFHNIHFLACTAWTMLLWFALRYWQTHQGKAIREFKTDTYSFINTELMVNYIQKNTNLKYLKNNGFVSAIFTPQGNKWYISYIIADNVELNSNGSLDSFSKKSSHLLELKGFSGLVIKAKCFLQALIRKPGFTSYIAPYLLFYAALISPIYKLISSPL